PPLLHSFPTRRSSDLVFKRHYASPFRNSSISFNACTYPLTFHLGSVDPFAISTCWHNSSTSSSDKSLAQASLKLLNVNSSISIFGGTPSRTALVTSTALLNTSRLASSVTRVQNARMSGVFS